MNDGYLLGRAVASQPKVSLPTAELISSPRQKAGNHGNLLTRKTGDCAMSEAMTKSRDSRTDTPSVSVYQEYDRRKRELFLKYGHGPEYDGALRDLIDELGI